MKFFPRYFLLSIAALFVTATTLAGDGNSFPPQRVQIDFANPLKGGDLFKFDHASLVVLLTKPSADQLRELTDLRPASILIAVGKQQLRVPEVIVRDLGPLDLSGTKLEWGFGQYRLQLSGTLGAERGEIAFFWSAKDGAPLGLRANGKDWNSHYPEAFAASPTRTKQPPAKPK